ncbi:hypothetical protein [Haladaptatus sp. R4]|uniref:hypothetical protein n=1 Tax=Haladaptatus sp. R4 TaxID=1679489 RepID=UPI001CBE3652|nr:hypothetical protein [Haladaptatus sp. R4]
MTFGQVALATLVPASSPLVIAAGECGLLVLLLGSLATVGTGGVAGRRILVGAGVIAVTGGGTWLLYLGSGTLWVPTVGLVIALVLASYGLLRTRRSFESANRNGGGRYTRVRRWSEGGRRVSTDVAPTAADEDGSEVEAADNSAITGDDEELAARVALLAEENERLRREYRRARQAEYRRTALALVGCGALAALAGVLFPDARSTLFALAGTGLFAGVLTYFLTPNRIVPASVGERTYAAYGALRRDAPRRNWG